MNAVIHVSAGELIDKITILEIKKTRISDKVKLRYINNELKLLQRSLSVMIKENKINKPEILKLKNQLHGINVRLWNIENTIRELEAKKNFGKRFIENARNVYITNDRRSTVKNKINTLFGSSITEVKEYSDY